MKNDVISCADMIQQAYSNIEKTAYEKNNKFSSAWKKILTSIKNYNSNLGQNLYEHSNVIEIKNNILLIEADHPGWIQMFHMNKKYILNGLKMFVPELNIVSLAFRLKGSNATLTNVKYDAEFKKESSKMKENLEKDEKKISEFDKNRKKTESISSSLPNELLSKFKEMENTALSRK